MKWFMIKCGVCDIGMPFSSAKERGEWAREHSAGTKHEQWIVWEEERTGLPKLKLIPLDADGNPDESKEPFTAEVREGKFVPTPTPTAMQRMLDERPILSAADGMTIHPEPDFTAETIGDGMPIILSKWELTNAQMAQFPDLVRKNSVMILNELTRTSRRVDEATAALQIAAREVLGSRGGDDRSHRSPVSPGALDALQAAIDALDALIPRKADREGEEG